MMPRPPSSANWCFGWRACYGDYGAQPRSRPACSRSSVKQAPHLDSELQKLPGEACDVIEIFQPGRNSRGRELARCFLRLADLDREISNGLAAMRRRSGARPGKRSSRCNSCSGACRAVVIGKPWIAGKGKTGIRCATQIKLAHRFGVSSNSDPIRYRQIPGRRNGCSATKPMIAPNCAMYWMSAEPSRSFQSAAIASDRTASQNATISFAGGSRVRSTS